jgi:hypothetical protein
MNAKVKKVLEYTGIIGSIISAIAYIVMTYVIVVGFSSAVDMEKQILFAVLGSLVGLIITMLLRSQGIQFASKEEESKVIMKKYYEVMNKKKSVKQLHTIKHYVIVQTIMDIFSKGISVGVSTWFVLYIFMEGNGDYSLFMLAVSNILMFAGFGLVALSKAYDKYMDEHIPAIKEIILKLDQARSIAQKEKDNANIQQRTILIAPPAGGEEPNRHPNYPRLLDIIWGQSI